MSKRRRIAAFAISQQKSATEADSVALFIWTF
jgi:hypothetical protein